MKKCSHLRMIKVGKGYEARLTGGCSNLKVLYENDGGQNTDAKLEVSSQACRCCSEFDPDVVMTRDMVDDQGAKKA